MTKTRKTTLNIIIRDSEDYVSCDFPGNADKYTYNGLHLIQEVAKYLADTSNEGPKHSHEYELIQYKLKIFAKAKKNLVSEELEILENIVHLRNKWEENLHAITKAREVVTIIEEKVSPISK